METCCQESILTVCLHEQEAGHSPKPELGVRWAQDFPPCLAESNASRCLQMLPGHWGCSVKHRSSSSSTWRFMQRAGHNWSSNKCLAPRNSFRGWVQSFQQNVPRCHERERAKSPFGLVQWLNSSILYVSNGQSQACQRWGSLLKATLNLSAASPQQQKVRDSRLQSKENQTQLRAALSITVTSQIRSTLEAHLQPEAATPGVCLYVEPDKSKWIQMANSHVSSKLKARETSGLIAKDIGWYSQSFIMNLKN